MDTAVQIIGLTIMCLSMAGFFGTLFWITRINSRQRDKDRPQRQKRSSNAPQNPFIRIAVRKMTNAPMVANPTIAMMANRKPLTTDSIGVLL